MYTAPFFYKGLARASGKPPEKNANCKKATEKRVKISRGNMQGICWDNGKKLVESHF